MTHNNALLKLDFITNTCTNNCEYLKLSGVQNHINKIYADFKIELEDAKAQGFREAIKEMGKVKGV